MSEITPKAVKVALDAATPGPWAWRQHTTDGIEDVLEPYMCQAEGFIEVSESDARLIAMAPDLATAYLAQAEEIERLRKRVKDMSSDIRIGRIHCEALSEIKATIDGKSDQPVADVIEGCIAEVAAYRASAEGEG